MGPKFATDLRGRECNMVKSEKVGVSVIS
jgi:hypothetical protein